MRGRAGRPGAASTGRRADRGFLDQQRSLRAHLPPRWRSSPDDADHPVLHDALGRAAGQGAGDEPAVAVRGVRPDGRRLPGRAPRVALQLRQPGRDRSPQQPVLLFAVAFGLSTDYGVFLLGRIKELHDAGLSNEEAVALGLQRTARIVTFAAALMVIAIGCFVTASIIFIKQLGFGVAVAVLIDATIVRALLVPALMRLLGRLELVVFASTRQTAPGMREVGYLGLGSNVGDRRTNLQATVELLWAHDVTVLCCPRRSTRPSRSAKCSTQRAFYNACLRIETNLEARAAARRVQGGRARVRARAGGRPGLRQGRPARDRRRRAAAGGHAVRLRAARRSRTARVTSRRFVLWGCWSSTRTFQVPGKRRRRRCAGARRRARTCTRVGPPLDVGP